MTRRPYIDTQAAIYTVVQKTIFFSFFGGGGGASQQARQGIKNEQGVGSMGGG
jgi:hypothetical protein